MTEEKKVAIDRWYDLYSKAVSASALSNIEVFYSRFEKTPIEDIENDIDILSSKIA